MNKTPEQAAAERADLDACGTIFVTEVMSGYGLRDGEEGDPAKQLNLATKDSELFGTGFLVDGVRVAPSRVTVIRKKHWPHVTTAELYADLRNVLLSKGATDAWIDYALPALQLAATQYASSQWAQGHAYAMAGNPLPNPQGSALPTAES